MARSWNKVYFEDAELEAYQEIVDGHVERYVDAAGVELFVAPPPGGCRVTEADSSPPKRVTDLGALRDQAAEAEKATKEAAKAVDIKLALKEVVGIALNSSSLDDATADRLRELEKLAD